MKSYAEPTNELIDSAEALTRGPHLARYFFDRLQNPLWLKPLADRGFFSEPPAPIHAEGGDIRHPIWPESKYLARMASADPETVADIFLGFATANASVVRDMIDAMAEMPAQTAARLVPAICVACRS